MIRRKIDSITANLTFSAFFCSILGWGLFEIMLFQRSGGIRSHLMVTLIGGIISTLALRRCRTWLPGLGSVNPCTQISSNGYGAKDVFPCLALAGIGGLWGLSIKSGSCSFFAFCLAGLIFFPWSKINFCLRHFFISSAALAVGAGGALLSRGALVPGGTLVDLFPYIFDAWTLWVMAVSLVLTTYRKPGATMGEGPKKVHPQSSDDAMAPN
jgi:hypothetical protein